MADIHTALDTGTPLELGFIYEHADSHGRFCPVDGQQRLTTLFLVHLMVFATDPDAQKWLEDFTYETRVTSRRFFDKLTRKRACLASTPTPSSVIRDTTWYSPAWNHDPTVQGALVMLDAIAEKMKLHDDEQRRCTYARRLSSDEAPLRFSFLSTNALGQADSLSMRLNARGKPLTPFETYKARLDKACPEKLLLTQKRREAQARRRATSRPRTSLASLRSTAPASSTRKITPRAYMSTQFAVGLFVMGGASSYPATLSTHRSRSLVEVTLTMPRAHTR